MGLGDTLGVLPIENMQLKVSDEVSGLSAADGYAISPKGVYDFMNELLNREKSGARIYNEHGTIKAVANGTALAVSGSTVVVKASNPYIVFVSTESHDAYGTDVLSATILINGQNFNLSDSPSSNSNNDTYHAGSAVIYLKKGDVVSLPESSNKVISSVSISEQ